MKMSSILFCLVGVVIICSVWVVISMSKKRLLMSEGYACPCMVQSGQLMSGRLRSPPTFLAIMLPFQLLDTKNTSRGCARLCQRPS